VGTIGRGAGNRSNGQVSFASRNNDDTDHPSNAIRFVGSLRIDSTPRGARVILDGVSRGSAPLTLSELRAGTHTVRLELDGYQRWTTAVTVVSGRHVHLSPVLQPRRDRDAANNPE
jgi:hypothetical protein